jgi:hypothetical protein
MKHEDFEFLRGFKNLLHVDIAINGYGIAKEYVLNRHANEEDPEIEADIESMRMHLKAMVPIEINAKTVKVTYNHAEFRVRLPNEPNLGACFFYEWAEPLLEKIVAEDQKNVTWEWYERFEDDIDGDGIWVKRKDGEWPELENMRYDDDAY